MKIINRFKLFIYLIAPILFLTSCDEKPPVTEYFSIEGFFVCNERSVHAGINNYLVEIDKVASQVNLFIINNFHNTGENEFLYAELNGDSLFIDNQVIGTLFVYGKGVVSADFRQVELSYYTDDGIVQLDYYATLRRE